MGKAGQAEHQQHAVAAQRQHKAELKYLRAAEFFAQQGVKHHHAKNLRRTAHGGKQGVGGFPACTAEVVLKEIDDEVRGKVQRRVDQHDAAYHYHSLIVAEQGGEHLLYGGGLHLTGGGFFHGNAAHQLCHCKNCRYDQCHPAEASALAVAAKGSHQQHGEHGDEGRANACTGTPHHGKVLPVFWGAGHGRDHGPVRNIHHGIGDAPQDVHHAEIDHQRRFVQHRGGKQGVEHQRIEQRAGKDPRTETSPAGAGLCHQNSHKGVVEGIKEPGRHEHDAHKAGRKPQHILIIIHDVRSRQGIYHILAHGTNTKCGFLFQGQFHTASSFSMVNRTATGWVCGAETVSRASPAVPTVRR